MKIVEFVKSELRGWGKVERILFPLAIMLIAGISIILHDRRLALCSAICGISYTILAGKGKISCYLFGLGSTICYSIISFQNMFYAHFALNFLYYLPMQILGIFKWKKHLKKETGEIIKTKLSPKERILYFSSACILSIITTFVLTKTGDKSPFIDGTTTIFSILGLLMTIKRCIEQWYIWTLVNALSAIMWAYAFLNGANCFATVLMWSTYLALGIYFLATWHKELSNKLKDKTL